MTLQNKIITLIGIIIIFYVAIILFSDYELLINEISRFDSKYLPVIFGLMIIHTLISTVKFQRLLKNIGIKLPFKDCLKIFVAGMSLGVTPAGIGIAIKSYILKTHYGRSVSSTIPLILVERWTEFIAILLLSSILLIWADLAESKIVIGIGIGFAVIVYILMSNSKTISSLKKIISKIKFISRFAGNFDETNESMIKLVRKKSLLEATMWSFSAKLVHIVTIYLIFLSFGIDLGLFLSAQIYYTSLILGIVTMIPAGVVVTELNMIGLITSQQIEFTIAALIVIFTRIVTTWSTTIIGVLTLKFGFKLD